MDHLRPDQAAGLLRLPKHEAEELRALSPGARSASCDNPARRFLGGEEMACP
jgi:hypothetical protein